MSDDLLDIVKYRKKNQGRSTDYAENDRENIENRLALLHTAWNAALVTQVALNQCSEYIKCCRQRREDNEKGLVVCTDIRYKDNIGVVIPIMTESISLPKTNKSHNITFIPFSYLYKA